MMNAYQELELNLLMQAIHERYGYEFRNYARASMLRRINKHMDATGVTRISELIPLFLYDEKAFALFVKYMSVTVTEMFRDPEFFLALREKVLPELKTFPFIKIWHAGCATGEEAYSMAILLEEEGILNRCQIYATDYNDVSLNTARNGIYPDKNIQLYEENYQKSGGQRAFSSYYSKGYDSVKFNSRLVEHITFANHNLASDGVFGEMNLILCRNVLIYFNGELQDRVLQMLSESLRSRGYLCLGNRENLQFSSIADQLETVVRNQRIFRKRG